MSNLAFFFIALAVAAIVYIGLAVWLHINSIDHNGDPLE